MKPRRWFRFSLRTMLVLMLLLSIVLARHKYLHRRHEAAFDVLRKVGGMIYYVDWDETAAANPGAPLYFLEQPPKQTFLRLLLGDEYFREPIDVNLNQRETLPNERPAHRECRDDDLKCLRDLPNVRLLEIASSKVTDSGIVHLSGIQGLNVLILDCPRLTDDSLRSLEAHKRLRTLALVRTQTTGAGIQRIKQAIPGLAVQVVDKSHPLSL